MFRPRRFPFAGLALFALGFVLASALAGPAASGAAIGLGALLLLPFLAMKMFFVMLLVGFAFRFVGGAPGWRGPSRHGRGPWDPARRTPPPPRSRSDDEQEWEEHLRQARQEVDDLWPDIDPDRPWGGAEPDEEQDRHPNDGSVED